MNWASLCTDCLTIRGAEDDAACSACGGPVQLFASEGEARLRARIVLGLAPAPMSSPREPKGLPASSDPLWLSVDEVAQRLNLNRDTVSKMVRDGRLPAVNAGTIKKPRYRVAAADVIRPPAPSSPTALAPVATTPPAASAAVVEVERLMLEVRRRSRPKEQAS